MNLNFSENYILRNIRERKIRSLKETNKRLAFDDSLVPITEHHTISDTIHTKKNKTKRYKSDFVVIWRQETV